MENNMRKYIPLVLLMPAIYDLNADAGIFFWKRF